MERTRSPLYWSGQLLWISVLRSCRARDDPLSAFIYFWALEGWISGKPQPLSRLHPAPSKYAGKCKQLHVSTENGNSTQISAKRVEFNRSLAAPRLVRSALVFSFQASGIAEANPVKMSQVTRLQNYCRSETGPEYFVQG